MQFEWRHEGPAEACEPRCRFWISATGAITADTPRTFLNFIEGRDLRGGTLALDSDGGSVLGAIALGREIRRLDLTTVVGKTVEIAAADAGDPRATLSASADCESMCTFVLLAGARRHVPAQARVFVHQIWLGDRRDDPTAASYSAEDLVLVQRDIGRLAQYTAEMGGGAELLELALRIPPWEPMRALSRDELRRIRLDTADNAFDREPVAPTATTSSPAATGSTHAARVTQRGWTMIERAGATVLARRHPLTVEGDNIGSFDLVVACGEGADGYLVSYTERRRGRDPQRHPAPLNNVTLRVGEKSAPLAIVSSERKSEPPELDTLASGVVPAALIQRLAGLGSRSLTVATSSPNTATSIRIGNTGISQNFPLLAANCGKPSAPERAQAPGAREHTGTLAHAQ